LLEHALLVALLTRNGSPAVLPKDGIRATEEEKEAQIAAVENLRAAYSEEAAKAIKDLQQAAIRNENMFEVLMEATKYCSLGQLTAAMFEVGGAVSKEHVAKGQFQTTNNQVHGIFHLFAPNQVARSR